MAKEISAELLVLNKLKETRKPVELEETEKQEETENWMKKKHLKTKATG